MQIELRFLQKAITDKNFISFSYQNKKYKEIKPLKLTLKEEKYSLLTQNEEFEFDKIKQLTINKKRFN